MNLFKYLRHQLIYLKKNASFEITNSYENGIRLLSKLNFEREIGGEPERRTGVYTQVHEDSSTVSTNKLPSKFEFRKMSIIKTYIEDWITKGLPFIYTRQTLNDGFIDLGLTALINNQKYRISLRVLEKTIEKEESLPKIDALFPSLAQSVGVYDKIHVYGSFLFQYLTNQPFVTQDSDLDILFAYKNNSLLEIKELLDTLNWTSKKAIDGEVRFYGETEVMDVSIKELLTNSTTLLVKTVEDTYLLSRETLYETYPSLCS